MKTTLRHLLLLIAIAFTAMTVHADNGLAAFCPFPKAGDGYWQQAVPAEMRADYIALGEQYLGKSWTAIPQETFAEFRTNGNRTHYETACFGIRTQFACLVMAEIMEQQGRFLPDICQGLHYFIDQEPWWGIPAHYPKAQPERDRQVVDLFNAETASMLAWTFYMLAPQIDRQEQGLSESVRAEIERRFLCPTLHEKQGWKRNANNWNTWITSNWIACALICERDSAEQAAALKGAADCLQLFADRYPADGGCEEGVGYWDRAAASLFEGLFWLKAPGSRNSQSSQSFPNSQSSQNTHLQAMGRFLPTMHIRDLRFVNFSDATAENLPNLNILFPFGADLHDAPMMELAAYVASRYDFFRRPSRLFLQSGNFPTLGRELLLLSMLPQLRATKAQQPRTTDAFLAQSQIMVASNETWLLAAKGGNNAESHNHNDIGSFILYHDNAPVVIDLGRDTYTSQTFSARRYEMMNNRSAYHNVPLIHGCEQMAGAQHKATAVSHEATADRSSLTMDFAQAYPDSAGITSWLQTLALDRKANKVSLSAQFIPHSTLHTPHSTLHTSHSTLHTSHSTLHTSHFTLICYGSPRLIKKGVIALQDGKVLLRFDHKLLIPAIEKVAMPDGIMKEQWHDNVYRLTLTLTKQSLQKGTVGYRFVQNQP